MGGDLDRSGLGDQVTDPADSRDKLGHGVLGRDRVIEQRRVQCPAAFPGQNTCRVDHRSHRVKDPPGRFVARSLERQ